MSARMPRLANMSAKVLPTRPVPTMLYFTAALHLGACVIDPMLSVLVAAVGLLDSEDRPLESASEVTKYRCCPSKD
jgi:hypothetical protein